ncbi:MAG TPA: TlpA disulfide reductase family protein [Candidatus Acidoferrales bacterium]|nr:TlpA disulfide reductase family protein [Candidatus Acidoferrales bacterium]
MKKAILIGIGLACLLALLFWADKKFPAARNQETKTAESVGASSMESIPIKDLQDHDVTLTDYKGKVVLVNFWATWCEPCQIEIPWMMEFQTKYGPRGFTILGVSMDEEGKKAVAPFLEKSRFDLDGQKQAMNYPILLGNDAIAAKFGGILGLPTSMLISRDGRKIKTITGLVDHDDLAKAIEGLL